MILYTLAQGQDNNTAFSTSNYLPSRDTAIIRNAMTIALDIETIYPDSAYMIYQRTFKESIERNFDFGIANSLRRMGDLKAKREDFVTARLFYNKSIQYCMTRPSLGFMLPNLFNNVGISYQNIGQYENAIAAYTKALQTKDQYPGTTLEKSAVLLNLSGPFISLRQYKSANRYLDLAASEALKQNDNKLYQEALENKGCVAGLQRDYQAGKKYFEESIEISERYHFNKNTALINIGVIDYLQKDYDTALSILLNTLSKTDAISKTDRVTALKTIGELYLTEKKYDKAEGYLLQALKESRGLHQPEYIAECSGFLANLYKETGNFKKAIQFQDSYMQIKDSLNSIEVSRNVNTLEINYRTAQKDKTLAEQQLTIVKQQNGMKAMALWILAIGSALLLLLITLLAVRHMYRNKQVKLNQQLYHQQQAEILLRQQKELELLKATMAGEEKERERIARELHDGIGGMLAATKMKVSTRQTMVDPDVHKEQILAMLTATADEVRKTAHNLMPDVLIKNGLENALTIYCDAISSAGNLQLDIDFQGMPYHLSKAAELVIYRITQELIQNVIKHADATVTAVLIKKLKNKFSVIVEDDGVGFNNDILHEGLGLQNLRFRVLALQGNIEISSSLGKGTLVHIDFDIERLQDKIA
ncbi:MAG: tetratricopeptide repeat protein [Flavipsychrobacter sp.]|nr:tetratricopeptide repeat protein [Flavipsychrobacter sp.]